MKVSFACIIATHVLLLHMYYCYTGHGMKKPSFCELHERSYEIFRLKSVLTLGTNQSLILKGCILTLSGISCGTAGSSQDTIVVGP